MDCCNLIPDAKYIRKEKGKISPIDKQRRIEILCPFTGNQLSSKMCLKCSYCQKFQGKHQSNRTLTSLICLYGQKKGSDTSES